MNHYGFEFFSSAVAKGQGFLNGFFDINAEVENVFLLFGHVIVLTVCVMFSFPEVLQWNWCGVIRNTLVFGVKLLVYFYISIVQYVIFLLPTTDVINKMLTRLLIHLGYEIVSDNDQSAIKELLYNASVVLAVITMLTSAHVLLEIQHIVSQLLRWLARSCWGDGRRVHFLVGHGGGGHGQDGGSSDAGDAVPRPATRRALALVFRHQQQRQAGSRNWNSPSNTSTSLRSTVSTGDLRMNSTSGGL